MQRERSNPTPVLVFRGELEYNCALFLQNAALVTGSSSGNVDLWNLNTRRPEISTRIHEYSVLSLSNWSHNNLLGTCSRDGTVKIWDIERNFNGEPTIILPTGANHFCNASTDWLNGPPHLIVTPSEIQSNLCLWDIRSLQVASKYTIPPQCGLTSSVLLRMESSAAAITNCADKNSLLDMDLSSYSASLVLVGGEDGSLIAFDMRSSRMLHMLRVHDLQPVFAISMKWSTASPYVLTGSADDKLHASRLIRQQQTSTVIPSPEGPIRPAQLPVIADTARVGSTNGSVEAPESEIPESTVVSATSLTFSRPGTSSISIRRDDRIAVSGHWDGTVRVFDCSRPGLELKPLATLRHHRSSVYGVHFNPYCDNNPFYGHFASSSKDGTIAVWNLYANKIKPVKS